MRQQALENLHRLAPHLWKRGRQALARLELLGDGATTDFDPDKPRAPHGPKGPSGDPRPLFVLALERLVEADTVHRVQSAVEWAENVYKDAQRSNPAVRPRGESEAQRAERIIDEGEGMSLPDAAQHFRVPQGEVKRARKDAACFIADGRPLSEVVDTDVESTVRELSQRGWSQREIARKVSKPQTTIHRMLKDAAA